MGELSIANNKSIGPDEERDIIKELIIPEFIL